MELTTRSCVVCGGAMRVRVEPNTHAVRHAELSECVRYLRESVDDLEGTVDELKERCDNAVSAVAALGNELRDLAEQNKKDHRHLHNMANAAAYGI